MSERDAKIVELALQGLSGPKIAERTGISLSTVQIVSRKHLGKRSNVNNSAANQIGHLRPYIEECFRQLGKDWFLCEICGERQRKKCEIHHTKYEGATLYDLQLVCKSCNLARSQHGLS